MKDQAIWLYRMFTHSNRRTLVADLQEQSQIPVGILFYHRVADSHPNGWSMSCADYSRQLDWLQDNFEVVTLDVAQTRIREGTDTPTVAITFDDGYADNTDFAIPELARRNLPATYFVSTDFVAQGKPFPHDVEAGVPLAPNSIDELKHYRDLGIEIGAHTRSHCDLGKVTERSVAEHEIVGSAQLLEDWLGVRMRYFAFPFGLPPNTSQVAVDVIRAHGFDGFCTAYGAWNWTQDSVYASQEDTSGFHLRRIHADPGIQRTKNWLTLDPRKLRERAELPFEVTALTSTE